MLILYIYLVMWFVLAFVFGSNYMNRKREYGVDEITRQHAQLAWLSLVWGPIGLFIVYVLDIRRTRGTCKEKTDGSN